jgi:hypothetical protein
VITECFDCKNPESHGFLDIKVNSVNWEVTLPFRVPKASLQKLTPGTAVKVTGIPHDRKAHNLYAREIIVNGINLPLAGSATAR